MTTPHVVPTVEPPIRGSHPGCADQPPFAHQQKHTDGGDPRGNVLIVVNTTLVGDRQHDGAARNAEVGCYPADRRGGIDDPLGGAQRRSHLRHWRGSHLRHVPFTYTEFGACVQPGKICVGVDSKHSRFWSYGWSLSTGGQYHMCPNDHVALLVLILFLFFGRLPHNF